MAHRENLNKAAESRTVIRATSHRTAAARCKERTFPVVIERDADGYFISCPVLQGCYSQGDTYEEAIENIKDAIRLNIEDRLANGEEVPEKVSVSLSTVEVTV